MSEVFTLGPPTNGYGTMSVTTASTTISSANITLGPNSAAFPTTAGFPFGLTVTVQGNSAAGVSFCPLGGTATATNGLVLTAGQSVTKDLRALTLATQPPSIIALTGMATVYIEW